MINLFLSCAKIQVLLISPKILFCHKYFLREQVQDQVVKLEYVPSKENIADIFTNKLPRASFEYLRKKLGVLPTPHSGA
jgi:hypothetical protein